MRSPQKWKLAFGLVTLFAILSVAANVAFTKALYESFVKLHFARIFPLGQTSIESPASANTSAKVSIAFWGDSRAFLWDKSTLSGNLNVQDHSHGGITSNQLILQLSTQSTPPSDYAVVQIGINDLHPLGALKHQKNHILRQLRHNILSVRDTLLERSKVVVMTTLFPPGRVPLTRRFAWDPETLQYVREINELIRSATDGKRVLLLDAHTVLADSDQYLDKRFSDNDFFLHVNREAYSRLNDHLLRLLANPQPPRN